MQLPGKNIAVTGRVKSWIKNPTGRMPVSCTGMTVQDSMEGKDGIEDSWLFTSKALRGGAGVALNLNNLRPKGTENGKGLTSSGVVSFAKFYSLLNQELRRGGVFKNGAVTLFLDYDHPDALEFITTSVSELPWVKRSLYVDEGVFDSPLLPEILKAMNRGQLWTAKKRWDNKGERLFTQVCHEIFFKSRSTCLLSHINLGQTTIDEIPNAFVEGMEFLCELHSKSGVDDSGIYRSSEDDKQVGLGVLGLANLLAIEKISYSDFVDSLENILDNGTLDNSKPSDRLAFNLYEGFQKAARVARKNGMERAFTVAPTATCAYNYRDREGFTTSPEISPPVANRDTKEVDRDSGTFGVTTYQYHPDIEIAADIPWELQFRLMKAWQRLMESTGLAHAISFNVWDKCKVDKSFLREWFESPLWTIYYINWRTSQDVLDKSSVLIETGSKNIFAPLIEVANEPTSCNLDGFCVSCAE